MNPLNQVLRETFLFTGRDLLANRAGRLSPRQQARQQSLGTSLKVGIAFFLVVMLGSLGFFAFASYGSGSFVGFDHPDTQVTLSILALVVGVIIVASIFSWRKQMAAAQSGQVQKAEGEAQPGKIRPNSANYELKIGRTKIRLLTEEQLRAFQSGTAYRVYYVPGPIPKILSAEVIGTEDEAAILTENEPPLEADSELQSQKRARLSVAILAVLSLCFPFVMFVASDLPGFWFLLVFFALFAVGMVFVFWALRK
jgi:hypothetical protein